MEIFLSIPWVHPHQWNCSLCSRTHQLQLHLLPQQLFSQASPPSFQSRQRCSGSLCPAQGVKREEPLIHIIFPFVLFLKMFSIARTVRPRAWNIEESKLGRRRGGEKMGWRSVTQWLSSSDEGSSCLSRGEAELRLSDSPVTTGRSQLILDFSYPSLSLRTRSCRFIRDQIIRDSARFSAQTLARLCITSAGEAAGRLLCPGLHLS